jgi:ubiquinone/menaquinone biosynthesis C-methylase UbiE
MLSLDRQNACRAQLRTLQPNWRPATEVYEATVRRYLEPGARLLDVGCGRGGVVEQLAGEGYWMVGIDPDRRSLLEHRMPAPALPRAAGFLSQLPYRSASFDLVISSWVLEHLPHPGAAFVEAARVLRPGGHLVTLAPNAWHPVTVMNRLLARVWPLQARLVPQLYGRAEEDTFTVCYRANTPHRLRQLGREAGLQTVSVQTISDPSYLAFNRTLFYLSRAMERLLPAAAWVHIVADFARI